MGKLLVCLFHYEEQNLCWQGPKKLKYMSPILCFPVRILSHSFVSYRFLLEIPIAFIACTTQINIDYLVFIVIKLRKTFQEKES